MNTDPAGTRSAHLDLEELIAEITGQPITGRAREHLATCEQCQLEASRWNLVARGVRGLAAGAPEASQPAQPRRTRQHALAGPRRRTMLAAAAAALVLIGGVGYAAITTLSRHGSGPVLTAVTGCTGVELATGTLEQVSGHGLVIKTASGQPVTVATTGSTTVTVAGALRRDITDGAAVIALGPRSGATIAAASVTLGPPPRRAGGNGTLRVTPPPGWGVARGTVADAGTAGFTVVTPGGTRVAVTTSGGTTVVIPRATLAQLHTGVTTIALGHPGPRWTLSALGVLQQPPGSMQVHFSPGAARGCPPASIAGAIAAALGSGG